MSIQLTYQLSLYCLLLTLLCDIRSVCIAYLLMNPISEFLLLSVQIKDIVKQTLKVRKRSLTLFPLKLHTNSVLALIISFLSAYFNKRSHFHLQAMNTMLYATRVCQRLRSYMPCSLSLNNDHMVSDINVIRDSLTRIDHRPVRHNWKDTSDLLYQWMH